MHGHVCVCMYMCTYVCMCVCGCMFGCIHYKLTDCILKYINKAIDIGVGQQYKQSHAHRTQQYQSYYDAYQPAGEATATATLLSLGAAR